MLVSQFTTFFNKKIKISQTKRTKLIYLFLPPNTSWCKTVILYETRTEAASFHLPSLFRLFSPAPSFKMFIWRPAKTTLVSHVNEEDETQNDLKFTVSQRIRTSAAALQ